MFLLWPHRVVGRCRKCMKLDNDARLRHDFSQYRAMLKELRRSEESFEDGSKITYLLQVGIHADSVICKMFWYKRDRDNSAYLHFQVLRSENKSPPSSRFFYFFLFVILYNCKPHLSASLVNVELEAYVVALDHNFTPVRACWVRQPVTSNDQWCEFSLCKPSLPFLRHSVPEFYPGGGGGYCHMWAI